MLKIFPIAGISVGLVCGAAFSSLFLSANWQPHAANVPLILLGAIGLGFGIIAAHQMRQRGFGFTAAALLGVALSTITAVVLVIWVVTGL